MMGTVSLRPLDAAGHRAGHRAGDPAGDREWLAALWAAALDPPWPVLRAGLEAVTTGLVAEVAGQAAGVVAFHPSGSIQLLLVHPEQQRRGVGTVLHDAALQELRAAGAGAVSLGSGAGSYVWPGVPVDLPAAAAFFRSRGWRFDHEVADLVRDLRGYRTPAGVHERAAGAGVTFTVAGAQDRGEVLAFEAAAFPQWLDGFERWEHSLLAARDAGGGVVGSLKFGGPGPVSAYAELLGPDSGAIAAVGVAPHMEGKGVGTAMVATASELLRDAGTRACLIDWTTRIRFYGRLGYAVWRRYQMARRPLTAVPEAPAGPAQPST